jgi:protein-S-isoprenylcysteine O-methyltransferase Ste14
VNHESSAYGLWSLVIINSLVFIAFAFSFTRPHTSRDWRSFGAFGAFIVALFTEMYGFPLTIYLLSGWLGKHYPAVNFYSHDAGHLWHTLLGLKGDPHFDPVHLSSMVFIFGGFILLSTAWRVLYAAQRSGTLATTGPYARLRPTLPTLAMFPILVFMYVRLAKREEQEAREQFGQQYESYAKVTPAFIPKLGRTPERGASGRPKGAHGIP